MGLSKNYVAPPRMTNVMGECDDKTWDAMFGFVCSLNPYFGYKVGHLRS